MRSMQPRDDHFASLISLIEEKRGMAPNSIISIARTKSRRVSNNERQTAFLREDWNTGSRRARLASIAAYVAFRSV